MIHDLALDLNTSLRKVRVVPGPLFFNHLPITAMVLAGLNSMVQFVPASLDSMEQFLGTCYSTCFKRIGNDLKRELQPCTNAQRARVFRAPQTTWLSTKREEAGGGGRKETQTEQEWEQTMGLGEEGKWGHQWGSKQSKQEARGPQLRQLLQRGQQQQALG